jgi:hypothetical protein
VRHNLGADPHKRFYEKVIRVKADVAALLKIVFRGWHEPRVVIWGAVKGVPSGTFIERIIVLRNFRMRLGVK